MSAVDAQQETGEGTFTHKVNQKLTGILVGCAQRPCVNNESLNVPHTSLALYVISDMGRQAYMLKFTCEPVY